MSGDLTATRIGLTLTTWLRVELGRSFLNIRSSFAIQSTRHIRRFQTHKENPVTMPIAIGLDLDGTLIDTSLRQKAALIKAARSVGVELPVDFPERYYEEKRSGISGREVLVRHQIERADEICALWTEMIEDQGLLAMDSPYLFVKEQMRKMQHEGFVFYVATARQHEDRAVEQVKQLGLSQLVFGLLVTRHGPEGKPLVTKQQLSASLGLRAIIGDTEMDMLWAEQLGVPFFPLSCGARCQEFWLERGFSPYESATSALEALRAVVRGSRFAFRA